MALPLQSCCTKDLRVNKSHHHHPTALNFAIWNNEVYLTGCWDSSQKDSPAKGKCFKCGFIPWALLYAVCCFSKMTGCCCCPILKSTSECLQKLLVDLEPYLCTILTAPIGRNGPGKQMLCPVSAQGLAS